MCKKKAKDTNDDSVEIKDIVETLSSEDRIALMAVLRDEWTHRNQTFFSYFWRFIYLSLVIIFLPTFFEAVMMKPVIVKMMHPGIFSFIGFLFPGFGMYIGLASNARIESVSDAYKRVLKTFPTGCAPRPLEKRFKPSLNRLRCIVGYGIMMIIAVINMVVTI